MGVLAIRVTDSTRKQINWSTKKYLKMSDILIDETTTMESILNFGLIIGAIFQALCILAVIFLPEQQQEVILNYRSLCYGTSSEI